MKLLICTQKVDENDAILGFFHGWIAEFAKHCEYVTVICLGEGTHHLPKNVKVLSLGKENFIDFKDFRLYGLFKKFRYVLHFWKYIWQERKNYDAVFVHMNQEYVLLGGFLWKLLRKKITMWRNHAKGGWATRVAVFLSDAVCCTSPQSFTARFEKTKIMPVGIDTDFFKPDLVKHKKKNSILFLGRIAPVKNVDIFIEALRELKNRGIEFHATIAGGSSNKDRGYEKMIHDKVATYGLGGNVVFTGAISKAEALKLYREHEVYVNLTPSGSMDKTIFEALASGSAVLVSNSFFSGKLPESWIVKNERDAEGLALAIKNTLRDAQEYNCNERKNISSFVERNSLKTLLRELMSAIVKATSQKK